MSVSREVQILDGRALARRLNGALKQEAARLSRPPGLAVVLVGSDPASQVYVRRKGIVADRLGFHHRQIDLPPETSQAELVRVLDALNADASIDGILLQLPLPAHLEASTLLDRIDPAKDVDGFTAINAGLLAQGRPNLVSCTPLGVLRLLKEADVWFRGMRACVIGRSNIVGRPMSHLLEQQDATVTLCHRFTGDLAPIVKESDIVVVAVGLPGLIKGEWIRPGAAVVDVGITRLEDGSLTGDVEFEAAKERAGAITPVPGGVGPMTIAMLMRNTFEASRRLQG